ncbi:MAG: DUF4124 domain-containing protein, partial [Desulfuromonadales bacterium]|nr:DUF4124 domain-containing protein [Desulfuromonadales bacterium]
MKKILCTALLLTLSTTCLAAKYYSWTDENGKRCFSNIPQKQAQQQLDTGSSELSYSGNIKQIPKRQPGNSAIRNSAIRNSVKKKTKTVTRTSLRSTNRHEQSQKPFITEANYGVIDGKVWRVGKGLVTVSVRVGKGPTCNNMTVRATARNKNGRLVY